MMNRLGRWIRDRIVPVVDDDEKRFRLQMVWVFRIVAVIVLVMSAVNLLTGEFAAIWPTIVFGVTCLACTWVIEVRPEWKYPPFCVLLLSITALFSWYIISGEPRASAPSGSASSRRWRCCCWGGSWAGSAA